jgi:hypothetical protein
MMNTTWTEELFSDGDSERNLLRGTDENVSRGVVQVKQKGDRLYALIGRRWCRVDHRADGRLVEIWVR